MTYTQVLAAKIAAFFDRVLVKIKKIEQNQTSDGLCVVIKGFSKKVVNLAH